MIAAVVLRTERATVSRTVCGIVVLLAFVISHPLAPVFLILAMVLAATVPRVMAMVGGVRLVSSSASVRRWWIRALTYTTVMYVAWISILTLVLRISLTHLIDAISAEGVIKPITYGRFLSVSLLAKVLGATAIVGAYWLLGVIVLRKRGPTSNGPALNLVLSLTFVGILLTVVFQIIAGGEFLGTFIERPIYIIALFTPPVASVFISAISEIRTSERNRWIVRVAAVTIPFMVAVPAMFPSPYVALFNYQNTQQLYVSTNWAAKFIPNSAEVLSNSYVGRYAYYPLQAGEQNYGKLYHLQNTIPSNFSQFLSSSAQGRYLILDKETIEVASLDLRAWEAPSTRDLAMINSAVTILRIYDSGEVQVYRTLG